MPLSLLDCDDGTHIAAANADTSCPQSADDRATTITGGRSGRVDDGMCRGGTTSTTTASTGIHRYGSLEALWKSRMLRKHSRKRIKHRLESKTIKRI